ncbi:MAG: SAM-dependent methyltransferase [Myxococcota bacterium]|jgi:SAM-dependent methyltransferase
MTADLYDEPALYDLLFGDVWSSVLWYRALVHEAGEDALECGCGTGRLTLPLARDGARVRALDRSAPMLARLQLHLDAEPALRERVQPVLGDFQALEPAAHDVALLPFNALHHCEDLEALNRTVAGLAASVRPGGTVALDAYLADPELFARGPGRHEEHTRTADGVEVECWEESTWEPPVHHVRYGLRWPDGEERHVQLRFRMFALEELRAAVRAAGLRLVHEGSDFGSGKLTAESTKWVAVAERPET